jgi:hypothetical protein
MSNLRDRLEVLDPAHRAALEWFLARRGELIGWPEPVDGVLLMERAKGIRVPAGWRHAVSIRQTLGSTYGDQPPEEDEKGGWTYRYFQEGKKPADRDRARANRALMACLEDEVPVAVLIQEKAKPRASYRVMGLARVENWTPDGFFHFEGYTSAGSLRSNDRQVADGRISNFEHAPPSGDFEPISPEDARKRIAAQIVARQGGKKFRANALRSYSGKCAISECDVASVLEAAHIVPFLGKHTNSPDNALLLRADLHTLFDRELLSIDPTTLTVKVSGELGGSMYAAFSGRRVATAADSSEDSLRKRLLERIALFSNK